jgi:hypothetical protein
MVRSVLTAGMTVLTLLSLARCCCAQSGGEQSGQVTSPPANISTPHQILLTGCLKRDSNARYYMTDQNGKTWELFSENINLAAHVYHSVTITGKEAPKQQEDRSQQSEASKAGGVPAIELRVITLKMLSPSCTR